MAKAFPTSLLLGGFLLLTGLISDQAQAQDGGLTVSGGTLTFGLGGGTGGTVMIGSGSTTITGGIYTIVGYVNTPATLSVNGTSLTLSDLNQATLATLNNTSTTTASTVTITSTFKPMGVGSFLGVVGDGTTTPFLVNTGGGNTFTIGGATDTQSLTVALTGATLTFDLASTTSHDEVVVGSTGQVAFSNTVMSLNGTNTGSLEAGTYTLFSASAGSGAYSGLTVNAGNQIIGGLALDSATLAGMNATLTLTGGDIALTLTAAPEPATNALLILGGGGLALTLLRRARPLRPASTPDRAGF